MYKDIAKSYDELHGEEQKKKLSIIEQNLLHKPKKLLDIGSGTGISILDAEEYAAIEPEEEMIKQSKKDIIKGEAENLPFNDHEFDTVTCITAIHNFNDPEKALLEMKRVAKENAQIIITILRRSNAFNNLKQLVEKHFKIKKEIPEEKDLILIGTKN